MSDYYASNDRYLSYGLAYLGFEYKKFNNDLKYGVTYSFKKSPELLNAIQEINKLRRKYNKYKK